MSVILPSTNERLVPPLSESESLSMERMSIKGIEIEDNQPTPFLKVLNNRDVLTAIFETFGFLRLGINGEMDGAHEVRKDLRLAALTCSAFFEAASDCLWRIMDSFDPLLHLLPSFKEVDGLYAIRGPISQADWRRFDYYARRVRLFVVRSDPGVKIAEYTFAQIASHGPHSFFPCLRDVCIISFQGATLNLSSLFLLQVSTLQRLIVGNISNTTFIDSFISSAAGTSPHLLSLHLEGGCASSSLACIGTLLSLTSLTLVLRGVTFDPSVVKTMSNLTRLVKLDMNFQGCPSIILKNPGPTILKAQDTPFASLEIFRCTGFARSLSIILQFMMEAPLRDLGLNIAKAARPNWSEDMSACMEAVGSLNCLEIIRIKNSSGGSDLGTDLKLFHPLGHLKLQVLEITDFRLEPSYYNLGSLTEWNCESGWRSLTHLHLPCDGKAERFSGETLALNHLTCFVNICPILEELKFFADLLEIPPLPDHIPNHPLNRLIIGSRRGKWAVGDMVDIARYIDRLFPHLEQLQGYAVEGPECDPDSNWGHVESILLSYQAVRGEGFTLGRESMERDWSD